MENADGKTCGKWHAENQKDSKEVPSPKVIAVVPNWVLLSSGLRVPAVLAHPMWEI